MVQLSGVRFGVLKTFGQMTKRKNWNHRKPLRYQRFQASIDPEEILAHYSRDDIDSINPHAGERTYKDATESISRKNLILPNLRDNDLEANELFQQELDRQRAMVARINKIKVLVDSIPGQGTELYMNKDMSTPYDCARHIHEFISKRAVVAELLPIDSSSETNETDQKTIESSEDRSSDSSGENQLVTKTSNSEASTYWDMHRPLEDSCRIRFRHFSERNVGEVNKIYWRSCSFVLGMAIRLAFKDEIKVLLHSWPKPNIKDGSFVYDIALNLGDSWHPTESELRAFTKILWDIKNATLPFDRLRVDRDIARKLFSTNPFKLSQIDSILENASSLGKITVYRCGGLVDISIGPMISDTSHIGRITLASVHPFESDSNNFKGVFYRFQGVSLPQQLPISSYLYQNVLINKAKKLNKASL